MAVCTGFIEPFNLQCLLVNTLFGDPTIWLIGMMIVIFGLAAYFKMPNVIALSSIGLFIVIMANYVDRGFYILAVVIVSLISFYSIAKFISR
jgi:hypothetical protein